MGPKHRHGLDYTPLFKFLLSKVGQQWSQVHSEAVSRLDREEPIYWLVAPNNSALRPIVRVGESSYYSGLHVDDDNRLAVVAPYIRIEELLPACPCCTHTFNGVTMRNAYDPERQNMIFELAIGCE